MRNLTRLLLVIFARTGLFLAVLAWVLGQWWQGIGHSYCTRGAIDKTGLSLAIGPWTSTVWKINKSPISEVIQYIFNGDLQPSSDLYLGGQFVVVYLNHDVFLICVKHWLVVTFFVALNGILWFVYRKRSEAEPCEI